MYPTFCPSSGGLVLSEKLKYKSDMNAATLMQTNCTGYLILWLQEDMFNMLLPLTTILPDLNR